MDEKQKNRQRAYLRVLLSASLAVMMFLGVFYNAKPFFKSQAMAGWLLRLNSAHGIFADIKDQTLKKGILESYQYAFNDFDAHRPRSVSENASVYAWFLSCLFSVYVFLIFLASGPENSLVTRFRHYWTWVTIVLLGLGARLFLAYHTTCNYDMVSWYINRFIIDHGGNVFAVTGRYNYSPAWSWMIGELSRINHYVPQFPFMFVLRFFLICADLAVLIVVIRIAKLLNLNGPRTACLFFLNPVSIVISGYHGQFENLALLFLLTAIYFLIKYGKKALFLSWFLLTTGVVIKHLILNQILIVLRHFERSKAKVIALFAVTIVMFFLFFVPYWQDGKDNIWKHVFLYGGVGKYYGISSFQLNPMLMTVHKILFIFGLFLWSFLYRSASVLRGSLVGMLFFLVFSSGMAGQQFLLPIALGALIPSAGFFLFSFAASLFLLADINELNIQFLNEFTSWNMVWIAAIAWFIFELKADNLDRTALCDRDSSFGINGP